MTKEELIKNQFPNDEFLQSGVLQIVDKCTAELEKENAELKADNDARKFAMAMSEKVEKQLREENAELKNQLEMSNKVYNDNLDYSHHIEEQLTKGKELVRSLYYIIKDRIDYENNIGIKDEMWRAEQFLKDSEVEK